MLDALDVAPVAHGIAADELIRRVPYRSVANKLRADELERWLLERNLARLENGLLVPTRLGVELGVCLDEVSRFA